MLQAFRRLEARVRRDAKQLGDFVSTWAKHWFELRLALVTSLNHLEERKLRCLEASNDQIIGDGGGGGWRGEVDRC